ncbi:MAG: DUF2971 domain-containing protein [Syntrophales bacterium]|nr:DUF2971 domain-containing protein [Syntrophales bacterium]
MTLPKYLYHYTSQKGLLGILESKKLWMTNIFYLNDSSEFVYTINLVKDELKIRIEQLEKQGLPLLPREGNLLDKCNRYKRTEGVLDIFLEEMATESYVFSLSTEGDDLNQWRGYCPKEGGFSIQFDYEIMLSIIDNMKDRNNIDIKKCEYGEKRKLELVKSLLDILCDDKRFFYKELVDVSSYIKHESFEKEQEYRIIYHNNPKIIEYREGNYSIIPYTVISPLDNYDKLPISKIFVGPTPHPQLSMMSVDSLLKSNGYENVKVQESIIPYRS